MKAGMTKLEAQFLFPIVLSKMFFIPEIKKKKPKQYIKYQYMKS